LAAGDLTVAVVVVVVVAVHVLGLERVGGAAAAVAQTRADPRLATASLLLGDFRLVRLEHHRRGLVVIFGIVVLSREGGRHVHVIAVFLPPPDPAAALLRAAVALDRVIAVALEVVVEGELLFGRDVLQRVNADAQLAVHHPLLRLAVGRARVVQEPSRVTSLGGVDRLRARQRHEVVVSLLLGFVPVLAQTVLVLVKHLADVLDDELAFSQRLLGEQAVAFLARPPNVQLGVLLALELLVLTFGAARTKVGVALHEHVAVYALVAAPDAGYRIRDARADQDVILSHALGFAVREDVTVDPVPHVVVDPGGTRLVVVTRTLLLLLVPTRPSRAGRQTSRDHGLASALLLGILLRLEQDVDLVVVDLLRSLARVVPRVVVQLAEPARSGRSGTSESE
jgi:hypothetical protein